MEAFDDPAGETVVVSLSGELDAADTGWRDEVEAALAAGRRRFVIDLLNVTFIDSSVIQGLIITFKRVGDDGWVRLVYTHHLIGRVIEICGLADTFPQFTSVEAALRSAPSRLGSARSAGHGHEQARAEAARHFLSVADTAMGDVHDEP